MKRGKTGQCMNYKLTKENIREAIYSNPRFAFLKKVVEEIPMETEQDQTVTYCGAQLDLNNPHENQSALSTIKQYKQESLLGKRKSP